MPLQNGCMTHALVTTLEDAARAVPPILVVDDSKAQRLLLTRTLAKWGYDTLEAASGEDALAICQGTTIDIIISDWMMPGMSGVEFCRIFRGLLPERPAYFILLTAQTEREVLAEGLESGADDFLSKPFNAVELKARLRAGERIVKAQRDLSDKNAALSDTLTELSDAYAAIDRDLRGARTFQEGLVPERHLVLDGIEVSLLFRSSGHVGGDLVGYFRINANEIGVYSVDVSGHGVASALMTARIAELFSDHAPERNIALKPAGERYELRQLENAFAALNEILQSDVDSDQYLTMALAHVNLATGHVDICQAGHTSPAIQRRDGRVEYLDLSSTPIGLIEEGEFVRTSLTLQTGDRLVLYSDGITECADQAGTLLDEAGFAEILKRNVEKHGPDLVDAMVSDLIAFGGREDFGDDLSAAVIERV